MKNTKSVGTIGNITDYLTQVKKMSPVVVQEIDSITSNILSKMEYPDREGLERRGLVMGSVQSEKQEITPAWLPKQLMQVTNLL